MRDKIITNLQARLAHAEAERDDLVASLASLRERWHAYMCGDLQAQVYFEDVAVIFDALDQKKVGKMK